MKKFLSLICVFVLSLALFSCSEKKDDDDSSEITNPINVTISFSDSENDQVEVENFEPIENAEFIVEEGTSVLEATQIYCVANELDIEIDSAGGYITGLLGISDGDYSDNTGWVYTINGETVMVGADEQILKDGDKISWEFVTFLLISSNIISSNTKVVYY